MFSFKKYMRHLPYFLVGIFLVLVTSIFAQSPYQINKSDWPIAIGGSLIFVSGRVLKTKVKPLTTTQVSLLDVTSINSFDRSATEHWSLKADKASDHLRNTANLLPLPQEPPVPQVPSLVHPFGTPLLSVEHEVQPIILYFEMSNLLI